MTILREKQEYIFKLDKGLEKRAVIGDPEGIAYIVRCLMNGTNSVQSLKTLVQNKCSKKAVETEASLLLLKSMGLVDFQDDSIVHTRLLADHFNNDKNFNDWFVDQFVAFVMDEHIVDVESITYEIGIDAFVMSPGSIKMKHAGFRNLLVSYDIISLRSDARYIIKQKLDRYLTQPQIRKAISEKQFLLQQQKRKELGNNGEEWVLEFEKRRITNPKLRIRIKRISVIDVGAGFDIVSFSSNDSTDIDRFIEVKTYKGNKHFHWSHNELEKASLMGDQYFIYLVDADCFECNDYEPQIIQNPIKNIALSDEWVKRPDSYLVEQASTARMGTACLLFQNDNNSFPALPYQSPIEISQSKPEMHITTEQITVTTTDNASINMTAAESVLEEAYSSMPMTDNALIKYAVRQLQALKIVDGYGCQTEEYLFKAKADWQIVYRVLVDRGRLAANMYAAFSEFFQYGNSEYRIPLDVEAVKKANMGIFAKPLSEWDISKVHQATTFRRKKQIAEKFIELLEGTM